MDRIIFTLSATMLVTFSLGSVHAFSVFIVPLEVLLHSSRAEISLIYAFALVALTFAVLIGYRIYCLLPAWWLVLITCLLASSGLLLASKASNWWTLFAGYSLAFGFSNGVGYGYSLQLVGKVLPEIKGLAMGAVTASYAVGSIVFAKLIAWQIEMFSVEAALLAIALAVVICGIVAAGLLRVANVIYVDTPVAIGCDAARIDRRKILEFWLAYVCSVFAGLMSIGHAAGILIAKNSSVELATLAAITIGIGSACGGFVSGWLTDRWPVIRLLITLPLLAAVALVTLSIADNPVTIVALLSLVGFSYGSIIAIYPVVIANYFGAQGPQAYGLVFTAWGFAGLVAPWSAGIIFDLTASYQPAMLVAATIAILSAVFATSFKFERTS